MFTPFYVLEGRLTAISFTLAWFYLFAIFAAVLSTEVKNVAIKTYRSLGFSFYRIAVEHISVFLCWILAAHFMYFLGANITGVALILAAWLDLGIFQEARDDKQSE